MFGSKKPKSQGGRPGGARKSVCLRHGQSSAACDYRCTAVNDNAKQPRYDEQDQAEPNSGW